MAEYKLSLEKREVTGKKTKELRAKGLIPSVIFGEKEPILAASEYVATEKVLLKAGYHSPIDLDVAGKKLLAIVKDIQIDPVSRQIINIEFQAISAKEVVEAVTPIVVVNFEESPATKMYHFVMTHALDEIAIKAKPADLPKELTIDASKLEKVEDKLVIADIALPNGVEFADKEINKDQVVISLYDPATEAAAREAEAETEAATEETAAIEGGAATEAPAETKEAEN